LGDSHINSIATVFVSWGKWGTILVGGERRGGA
jgi:hypothetical protein